MRVSRCKLVCCLNFEDDSNGGFLGRYDCYLGDVFGIVYVELRNLLFEMRDLNL